MSDLLSSQNKEWKEVGYWSRSRSGLSLQPGKIRWAGDTMQPPSDEGEALMLFATPIQDPRPIHALRRNTPHKVQIRFHRTCVSAYCSIASNRERI